MDGRKDNVKMEHLAPSRDYWRASVNISLYLLVQQNVAVGFSGTAVFHSVRWF
jgi:hypothetical protein